MRKLQPLVKQVIKKRLARLIKGLILAGRSKDEIASLFNECPRRSQDSRRVREGERQEKGGSKGKGTQEKRATEDSTIKKFAG